jgi:putative hydrolase of the HAD superfamily
LSAELGDPPVDVHAAMLASIRFTPYPDAAPTLRELRARGLRLVVASNWDCSLADVLAEAGLSNLLDGVATSAQAGAPKPDPRVFEAALELAGCPPERALHVGDSPLGDVAGAARAGIRAVLLRRPEARLDALPGDSEGPAPAAVVAGLAELPGLL